MHANNSDDGHQASARAVRVVQLFSMADSRTERLRVLLPASNSRRCIARTYLFKSAPWQVMESMTDIGDRWEYWKQLFWEIVDSHIPLKRARVRSKSLPWFTNEDKELLFYKGKEEQEG